MIKLNISKEKYVSVYLLLAIKPVWVDVDKLTYIKNAYDEERVYIDFAQDTDIPQAVVDVTGDSLEQIHNDIWAYLERSCNNDNR